MKKIEGLFKKQNINYGWVMVLVVFVLSGLALDPWHQFLFF